jgi:hypothetical protein
MGVDATQHLFMKAGSPALASRFTDTPRRHSVCHPVRICGRRYSTWRRCQEPAPMRRWRAPVLASLLPWKLRAPARSPTGRIAGLRASSAGGSAAGLRRPPTASSRGEDRWTSNVARQPLRAFRRHPVRAQPTSRIASWHACSHRRQTSAQMRQCSCCPAWRWHSSPHTRQPAAQTCSICPRICSLEPVRPDARAPVAEQTSAQSRLSRMHCLSSWTISSARQASAHAVHACAQA